MQFIRDKFTIPDRPWRRIEHRSKDIPLGFSVRTRIAKDGSISATDRPVLEMVLAISLPTVFVVVMSAAGLEAVRINGWSWLHAGNLLIFFSIVMALGAFCALYFSKFRRCFAIDAASKCVVYSVRSWRGEVVLKFSDRRVQFIVFPRETRGRGGTFRAGWVLIAQMPGGHSMAVVVWRTDRAMPQWLDKYGALLNAPLALSVRPLWARSPLEYWRHPDYKLPGRIRRKQACVHCGYSLIGLPNDTRCPECGELPPILPPGSSTTPARGA